MVGSQCSRHPPTLGCKSGPSNFWVFSAPLAPWIPDLNLAPGLGRQRLPVSWHSWKSEVSVWCQAPAEQCSLSVLLNRERG